MSLVADLRDDLLSLTRQTAANADPATLARVLADINAAVQRVYELGPDFWSAVDGGDQVRAPVTLTGLTLTNGATTLSGGSPASWMHGCTVQLGGESQQNQIRQTGASTYALAFPYQGADTAAGTGIVYHDAINLAGTLTKILPPVFIPGKWDLLPAFSPNDDFAAGFCPTSTDHGRLNEWRVFLDTVRDVGTPTIYRIERNLIYTNELTARIRLNPLPDAAYVLRWRQRNAAYRITSLADTVSYLVPHGYNETLLYPIARYLYAGSVNWALESEASRASIEEGYATALKLLKSLSEKQQLNQMAAYGGNA